MLTATERRQAIKSAERGILLMDQFVPNWATKVNTAALEMADPSQCIMGQVFGDFSNGLSEIAGVALKKVLAGTGLKLVNDSGDELQPCVDEYYYGFNAGPSIGYDEEPEYFSLLAETWAAAIAERKQAAKRSAARRRAARKAAATRRANRAAK